MKTGWIGSFAGLATLAAVLLCARGAAAQSSAGQPEAVAQESGATPSRAPDAAAAVPAPQQVPSASQAKASDWHVEWHPLYLFASSLSGTTGVGGLTTPVDAGFGEIIDEVNFAYASALDVRKNRVGGLLDLQFMNLGDSRNFTPGAAFSGSQLSAKTFILDPELYYRVKEGERGSFDAMVGFRYWHLHNKITFLPGILPRTTVEDSDNWADPVFGGRIILNLDKDKKWFLPIKGDVGGGGGSELTWQAFGGLGRNVGKRYMMLVGWRGLGVDRRNGVKIFDMKFHGPFMSFAIKFK